MQNILEGFSQIVLDYSCVFFFHISFNLSIMTFCFTKIEKGKPLKTYTSTKRNKYYTESEINTIQKLPQSQTP